MKDYSYENSFAFFISMTLMGVFCGLIAFLGNMLYPVLYIHQSFISEYLQIKVIDVLPSAYLKLMSFPLYMGLLFWVLGSPIDLFFKNREKYEYNFKHNIKKSFEELTHSSLKVLYYVLLFGLCLSLSNWLSNNVFNSLFESFGEQQLVMLPLLFIVAIAFVLLTMLNNFIKILNPKKTIKTTL